MKGKENESGLYLRTRPLRNFLGPGWDSRSLLIETIFPLPGLSSPEGPFPRLCWGGGRGSSRSPSRHYDSCIVPRLGSRDPRSHYCTYESGTIPVPFLLGFTTRMSRHPGYPHLQCPMSPFSIVRSVDFCIG